MNVLQGKKLKSRNPEVFLLDIEELTFLKNKISYHRLPLFFLPALSKKAQLPGAVFRSFYRLQLPLKRFTSSGSPALRICLMFVML